uniref:putative barnase/colicin E5 family endoribonuclease n=1 Tax=Helicobacter bizzozeronii TaxID=56877 RepID=UPI0022791BC0
LYDFLKGLPNKFVEASMPRLSFEGITSKKLADINVYDFAKELITSTQNPTQSVMRVASLLPELEKKATQASQALANTPEMQILQRAQDRSLTPKNTQGVLKEAREAGLQGKQALESLQANKEQIIKLLPYKRDIDLNDVIFKEDIKPTKQILEEAREAGLKNTQAIKAVELAKEAKRETSTFEQAWLKAFNLKSLDEPFIPKFSPEVQQVLEPILKGESIKLTRGSLAKLEKREREEFLPLIRPTLEEPNAILDNGRGILFIKEFIDPDKNRYFMSVAKNYDGEWVFSSHIRKDFSAIKNEFARSKVLYNTGFSGGEVAGASDILESGGTAIKPSDLQINTPPSHGSALNPASKNTKPPLKSPNIEPNPAFGEHFKEFEGKGAQAVAKLLQEKRGQVAGAFYREDLGESGGYIDLVWGASATDLKGLKDSNGKPLKPYGLSKILEKHASDFEGFKGVNIQEKLANGLEYLIKSGEAKDENNVKTIIGKHNGQTYRVGLSKGWDHKGDNYWVITAYKFDKSPGSDVLPSNQITKGDGTNLHPNDLSNSTKPPLKVQTRPWGDEVSAEPEEIVKIVRQQTFKLKSVPDYKRYVKENTEWIAEHTQILKDLDTEHAQMLEGTHSQYRAGDPEPGFIKKATQVGKFGTNAI